MLFRSDRDDRPQDGYERRVGSGPEGDDDETSYRIVGGRIKARDPNPEIEVERNAQDDVSHRATEQPI